MGKKGEQTMKVKTHLKAGALMPNHNETLVRDRAKGLKVKTHLKAGTLTPNNNNTLVRAVPTARGRRMKTSVKAGELRTDHNQTQHRHGAAAQRVTTRAK